MHGSVKESHGAFIFINIIIIIITHPASKSNLSGQVRCSLRNEVVCKSVCVVDETESMVYKLRWCVSAWPDERPFRYFPHGTGLYFAGKLGRIVSTPNLTRGKVKHEGHSLGGQLIRTTSIA